MPTFSENKREIVGIFSSIVNIGVVRDLFNPVEATQNQEAVSTLEFSIDSGGESLSIAAPDAQNIQTQGEANAALSRSFYPPGYSFPVKPDRPDVLPGRTWLGCRYHYGDWPLRAAQSAHAPVKNAVQ